jgi:hypothetical protein
MRAATGFSAKPGGAFVIPALAGHIRPKAKLPTVAEAASFGTSVIPELIKVGNLNCSASDDFICLGRIKSKGRTTDVSKVVSQQIH